MKGKPLVSNFWFKFLLAWLCVALLVSGLAPLGGFQAGQAYASPFLDEKIDPVLAEALAAAPLDAPLEVVIVFSDPAAASQVSALASTFYQMQALPMAGAILTKSQIQDLAGWPEIYSLTLNSPLEYFLAESVPLIGADQVWSQYGQTGGNATVAVIDTGIDATHPDLLLGSKVVQNVKVLPYQASLEDQLTTDNTSGHGTHVAGTIGGDGSFSAGYYRGVAPDARLVGLGAGETLGILTAVQAYDWVLEHHQEYDIRVVSNSWGSTGGNINLRNPVVMATYAAYQQGILSVFAAGNDGGYDVLNPYSLPPWLLSVAAGKKDGSLAEFSSRGKDGDYFKHPDITAPGVDIYAARAPGADSGTDTDPNPVNPLWTPVYAKLSGTSMATPHVSGAAALLFSSNPNLSPDQVMDLLTANAKPMQGYAFHEAGYGYLDVLAAYEASRSVAGNLPEFLAGDRQHSEEGVLGFDPDYPTPYDEILFTGFTPAGATGVSDPIDHQFDVPEGVLYVNVRLTWDPQIEDAYDMEVLDPQGRVVVSSGNGLDTGETALFVPEEIGTYTLRLYPFAAAASSYNALVKIAYGSQPENWPPDTEPQYDYYLGVVGTYKFYGAVGILSEYFRSGDIGFVIFSLKRGDGTAVTGAESQLQAIYTDREGTVVYVDDAIAERTTAGEYDSLFIVDDAWGGVPGPITVNFAWKDQGTMRALPTSFNLNHLDVTLETGATQYEAGDEIAFSGQVNQVNTLATSDVELLPLGGASVTIQLLDSNGEGLASTQAVTDAQGNYSGSIIAPAGTNGRATLRAEASYEDATIVLGPSSWYGKKEATLTFPGNLAPEVALEATPQTGASQKFFVHIEASASDPDGAGDITSITLTLTDAAGRQLKSWSLADFEQTDEFTWSLVRPYRLSGKAPWTLALTATDSAGESAASTFVIDRSD